jgi:hypothetical protein
MLATTIWLDKQFALYLDADLSDDARSMIPLQQEAWANLTNLILALGPVSWSVLNKVSCKVRFSAANGCNAPKLTNRQDADPKAAEKQKVRSQTISEILDLQPICGAPTCRRALVDYNLDGTGRTRTGSTPGRRISVHAYGCRRSPIVRGAPSLPKAIGYLLDCPYYLFRTTHHTAIRNCFAVLGTFYHYTPCKLERGKLSTVNNTLTR